MCGACGCGPAATVHSNPRSCGACPDTAHRGTPRPRRKYSTVRVRSCREPALEVCDGDRAGVHRFRTSVRDRRRCRVVVVRLPPVRLLHRRLPTARLCLGPHRNPLRPPVHGCSGSRWERWSVRSFTARGGHLRGSNPGSGCGRPPVLVRTQPGFRDHLPLARCVTVGRLRVPTRSKSPGREPRSRYICPPLHWT